MSESEFSICTVPRCGNASAGMVNGRWEGQCIPHALDTARRVLDISRARVTALEAVAVTWEAHAACHPDNRPPNMTAAQWTGMFFPPQGGDTRPAKAICVTCPVQAECCGLANSTPFERDGVWGGQSGRERRASRRTGRTGISYSAELREQGLRMYDQGYNYAQISERLGVPAQTPGNWVKNRRRGTSRRAS